MTFLPPPSLSLSVCVCMRACASVLLAYYLAFGAGPMDDPRTRVSLNNLRDRLHSVARYGTLHSRGALA